MAKNREQLIYDFMVALATNPVFVAKGISEEQTAYAILRQAENLADVYLEIA
jgi:hypothetical protein